MSLLFGACSPISAPNTPLKSFALCQGKYFSELQGLNDVYRQARPDSCKQAIEPFDMGAWIEAPLNSHKAKGLSTVVLGCANLTPTAESCDYGGLLGHSVTLTLNFDLTTYPDVASVQKAVLAFQIHNNAGFFAQTSQLRGRLHTADAFQSLGSNVVTPNSLPGWITYDITAFAARAINERRNSVSFEISLPCGRSESELTTVSVLAAQPKLIVEYR
jgi:hypothetical protein